MFLNVWDEKATVLIRSLMTKSKELPLECVWFILLHASFVFSFCIQCVCQLAHRLAFVALLLLFCFRDVTVARAT